MNKNTAAKRLADARTMYANALLTSKDADAVSERVNDAVDAAERDAADAVDDASVAWALEQEAANAVAAAEKVLAGTTPVVILQDDVLKAGELCKAALTDALNAAASISGEDAPGIEADVAAACAKAGNAAKALVTVLEVTATFYRKAAATTENCCRTQHG